MCFPTLNTFSNFTTQNECEGDSMKNATATSYETKLCVRVHLLEILKNWRKEITKSKNNKKKSTTHEMRSRKKTRANQ